MRSPTQPIVVAFLLAVALSVGTWRSASAGEIDWSKVEGEEILLFQPGQSSWEWQLTESDHSGGPKIREGKSCYACHLDEERRIGEQIATGKKLEPDPIAGMLAVIPVQVKMAHDGQRLYMHFEWETPPALGGQPQDVDVVARITALFDDGTVRGSKVAGCWITCHDDANEMASASADSDIEKYLAVAAVKLTRKGAGGDFKAPAELQTLLASGNFVEYWQARIAPDDTSSVQSGYVLETRTRENPGVEGSFLRSDGRNVAVLSRVLAASAPGQKAVVPGKTYTIGFALHEQHTHGRHHYVSFERSFVLDSGDATFVVKKQ